MGAIKYLITFYFIITNLIAFGQESKSLKDTIYLLYDDLKHSKKTLNNKEFSKVLYFEFEGTGVWYNYEKIPDTLCLKHLIEYKILTLNEVNDKEWKYYKNRFGKSPVIKNKNWVFNTYMIEVISNDRFVIYPVIWRNEGIID